jgi:hypothetical protein
MPDLREVDFAAFGGNGTPRTFQVAIREIAFGLIPKAQNNVSNHCL